MTRITMLLAKDYGVSGGIVNLNDLVDKYNENATDYSDYSMVSYYLISLLKLLKDEWSPDSAVYDLDNWTANLYYFHQRVANDPTKQFIIPVDFHY